MITYHEIISAARQLSIEDRVALLEELAHSLVLDLEPSGPPASSVARVRGMLKTDQPTPDRQELRESYSDYLIRKYS